MAKSSGKMVKIGGAGRTHKMGTGIQVDSIQVNVNGAGVTACMKSEGAQEAVNIRAEEVRRAAQYSAGGTTGAFAEWVVHPKVLRVSAHAFVDPANYAAILAQHHHGALEAAFWSTQGKG